MELHFQRVDFFSFCSCCFVLDCYVFPIAIVWFDRNENKLDLPEHAARIVKHATNRLPIQMCTHSCRSKYKNPARLSNQHVVYSKLFGQIVNSSLSKRSEAFCEKKGNCLWTGAVFSIKLNLIQKKNMPK